MADLLGQEAALFCASGTMTNQLGLRTLLTQPPHSVLCDARAHIFVYECGGIGYHSQASITPVTPKNGKYLTVEDVKANVVTDTLCGAPTKGNKNVGGGDKNLGIRSFSDPTGKIQLSPWRIHSMAP